jgi:hypothetical protein
MSAFSAPGESPPPPQRSTPGIGSDIRREVVSEVRTLVSDIRGALRSQEGVDGQHQSVSVTPAPSATGYTLTVA